MPIFNRGIGMYTIDRGKSSCIHKTEFCTEYCYNKKFYGTFKRKMEQRDKYNDAYWEYMTGDIIHEFLKRKRERKDRVRFCSRGEPFAKIEDVYKIADILEKNPKTKFWIPTKGYRAVDTRIKIEMSYLNRFYDNVFIFCSIDPSVNKDEVHDIKLRGFSTMFFGDDTENALRYRIMCPKTWAFKRRDKRKQGHCRTCNICFNDMHKRIDLHLKQH